MKFLTEKQMKKRRGHKNTIDITLVSICAMLYFVVFTGISQIELEFSNFEKKSCVMNSNAESWR